MVARAQRGTAAEPQRLFFERNQRSTIKDLRRSEMIGITMSKWLNTVAEVPTFVKVLIGSGVYTFKNKIIFHQ